VEILTLQDNYVDLAVMDGNEVGQRALSVKDMKIKNSVLAEHGFSAVVTVTSHDTPRSILFDFGFSEHGAAFNADALGVNLSTFEALVLSHGHMDHFGGLEALVKRVGKQGIEMVLHPTAFRKSRYSKVSEELKIKLPELTREKIEDAGITVILSKEPRALLDESLLFLGGDPQIYEF
jgi:7,8-dihydropterin-6-yl-methyl-4-(beta-D-ribofuranosyl)aminobenzene 5'-phosphate synthase